MSSYNKRRMLVFLGLLGVVGVGLELHSRLLTRFWGLRQDANLESSIPRGVVHYPWYRWEPQLLDSIRNKLSWKTGEVSLQAIGYMDGVEPPVAGSISVILINDTDNQLIIPAQDGDIYLKLEAKLEDGQWHRAQCHGDSWCGNSYGTQTLAAHSYVVIKGYQPTVGRKATVRFAIHNAAEDRLCSGEFDGAYSPDDVRMSDYDTLAMREAGLARLKSILLRHETPDILPENYSLDSMRRSAWHGIVSGRHEPAEALRVAEEVLSTDPSLEPHAKNIPSLMESWRSAKEHDTRGRVLLHGFTVSKRLATTQSP